MNKTAACIEALLFLKTKPLKPSSIARALSLSQDEVREGIETLIEFRNQEGSGIHVVQSEEGVVLVTNPAFAEVLADSSKEDLEGALTRPQLETLTIIAYRGPITKPEIEHIRGVNCTIILRHLMTRGLIQESDDPDKLLPVYTITTDMLRAMGVHDVSELPEYERLHTYERVNHMLDALNQEGN